MSTAAIDPGFLKGSDLFENQPEEVLKAVLSQGRVDTFGPGAFVFRLSGFRLVEPLSGQRAATARCLSQIRPFARGFGLETAMTIDLVRLGFKVGEIPVDMAHRPTGRTAAGRFRNALTGTKALATRVAASIA